PVAAIHVHGLYTVVRSPGALMFIDPRDRVQTRVAPQVTASELSPTGGMVITGDAEGAVTFWKAVIGEVMEQRPAHRAEVTHIVSTDRAPYSCAADGTILGWQQEGESWSIEWRLTAPA